MKIIYVIVADAVQANPNGKFSILGGGIENIQAFGFPAIHPALGLVVGLSAQASEANQSHDFRIDISGPNDFSVTAGGIPDFRFAASHNTSERPSVIKLVFNMGILVFPEPGTYHFHLYIDAKEADNFPLDVLELNPNDANSQEKQDQ